MAEPAQRLTEQVHEVHGVWVETVWEDGEWRRATRHHDEYGWRWSFSGGRCNHDAPHASARVRHLAMVTIGDDERAERHLSRNGRAAAFRIYDGHEVVNERR